MEKMFNIKYWENEEMRDIGESNDHIQKETEQEAIEEAKNLFFRQNFAAVEVEDEKGETVFHISNDVPNGEKY